MKLDGEDEKQPWPELEFSVLRGGFDKLLYDSYNVMLLTRKKIKVRRGGLRKSKLRKVRRTKSSAEEALVNFQG